MNNDVTCAPSMCSQNALGCTLESEKARFDLNNFVVAEPLINIFILVFCLRCPVVGTYRSLQWAVLHNERILQDKRNLITVSLFACCIYTAASLC